MPDFDLISGLIATYRKLNHDVRPTADARFAAGSGSPDPGFDLLREMRDREMRFSQALKTRMMSSGQAKWSEDEMPAIGLETEHDTPTMVIAQFGTARASTLAMLRDLPDRDWDAEANGKTIRTRVFELLDSDRRHLQQIEAIRAGH